MKTIIAGIILVFVVLGGLFVYTEGDSSGAPSNVQVAPVQDNSQYNIKID